MKVKANDRLYKISRNTNTTEQLCQWTASKNAFANTFTMKVNDSGVIHYYPSSHPLRTAPDSNNKTLDHNFTKMLTNFQNYSFTFILSSDCVMNSSLKIPSHLKRIRALVFKN